MYKMFFLCFVLLLPVPANAADDAYTVSGIAVDQPTSNPTTARDEALDVALKKAYAELKTRREAEGEILPAIESAPLSKLMQDFEVADERISATRYRGVFTIRFRSAALAGASAQAAAEVEAATPLLLQNAVFRFTNLMEWQAASTALKNTMGVRNVVITGLRKSQVDLRLAYVGTAEALAEALAKQGLGANLLQGDSGTWLITYQRL